VVVALIHEGFPAAICGLLDRGDVTATILALDCLVSFAEVATDLGHNDLIALRRVLEEAGALDMMEELTVHEKLVRPGR
jgi:hypothetical protein